MLFEGITATIFIIIIILLIYWFFKNFGVYELKYNLYGFSTGDYVCKKGYPLGKYKTMEQCMESSLKLRPRASYGQSCAPDKLCIDTAYCDKESLQCIRKRNLGESCNPSVPCNEGLICRNGKCVPDPKWKPYKGNQYSISIKFDDNNKIYSVTVNNDDYIAKGGIILRIFAKGSVPLLTENYRIDNDMKEKNIDETNRFIGDLYRVLEVIPELIVIAIVNTKPTDVSQDIRSIIERLGGRVITYMADNYVMVYDHQSSRFLYEDSGKDLQNTKTYEIGPFI